MGHNNFFDLKSLPEFVEGMKISDTEIECCEVCELNKSKKSLFKKIEWQGRKNFWTLCIQMSWEQFLLKLLMAVVMPLDL